jgi:hypothetical protein
VEHPGDRPAPREALAKGPAEDPAPNEELPSDIAFRWWLTRLRPEKVLQDLEGRVSFEEARVIADTRYRALQRGEPLPHVGPKRTTLESTTGKGNP